MNPDKICKLAQQFEKTAQEEFVTQKEFRGQVDTTMASVQDLLNEQRKIRKLLGFVMERLDAKFPGWQTK